MSNAEFWGTDIKRCAKTIAIIGTVASVLSFNILGFIVFVLAYIGVENQKPSYLLPAEIFLNIGFIFGILFILLFITHAVDKAGKAHEQTPSTRSCPHPEYANSPAKFVIGLITHLISTAFLFFSYVIVNKTRKHFLENNSVAEN